MKSRVGVVVETGTSIGELRVEHERLFTSDGDCVAEYYHVLVDNELTHPRLTSKGVMRVLASYMTSM
jgi:hypothetical protein